MNSSQQIFDAQSALDNQALIDASTAFVMLVTTQCPNIVYKLYYSYSISGDVLLSKIVQTYVDVHDNNLHAHRTIRNRYAMNHARTKVADVGLTDSDMCVIVNIFLAVYYAAKVLLQEIQPVSAGSKQFHDDLHITETARYLLYQSIEELDDLDNFYTHLQEQIIDFTWVQKQLIEGIND